MPTGLSQMRQATRFVQRNFSDAGQFPGLPLIRGTWYYVDPYAGSDTGRTGKSLSQAYASFLTAYNACTSGRGDGIVVYSGGTTAANTTSYMHAVLDWTKHAITVVGIAAPTGFFSRARIANDAAHLDLAYLVDVQGSNNSFYNIHLSNGGSNVAALGGLIVSGARNYFENCHVIGGGHATPAAAILCNCLSLKSSENTFINCSFGSNGFVRSTAVNAPIQFTTTQQGQNFFDGCRIYSKSSYSGTGGVNLIGTTVMNGWTEFRNCSFVNFSATGGANTNLTSVVVGSAQTDCGILMNGCVSVGWAAWGVTAHKVYVVNADATASGAGGLATTM